MGHRKYQQNYHNARPRQYNQGYAPEFVPHPQVLPQGPLYQEPYQDVGYYGPQVANHVPYPAVTVDPNTRYGMPTRTTSSTSSGYWPQPYPLQRPQMQLPPGVETFGDHNNPYTVVRTGPNKFRRMRIYALNSKFESYSEEENKVKVDLVGLDETIANAALALYPKRGNDYFERTKLPHNKAFRVSLDTGTDRGSTTYAAGLDAWDTYSNAFIRLHLGRPRWSHSDAYEELLKKVSDMRSGAARGQGRRYFGRRK